MINIDLINFATVVTVLIGSYIVATAIFQCSFCSSMRCSLSFSQRPHKTTLPVVVILLIVSAFLAWFDVKRFSKALEIITYTPLLLISWFIFIRSVFLFKRIPKWVLVLLLCGVSIGIWAETFLRDKGPPLWHSYQDLRGEMKPLIDNEKRRAHIADTLIKFLDKRINEIEAEKGTRSVWGEGPEKTWLRMRNLVQDEIKRQWAWFDNSFRFQMNSYVFLHLMVYFCWLLPMSFVAGRFGGFLYLRICPEIELDGVEDHKILLIHSPDLLVVADSRESDSRRTFLSGASIKQYTVIREVSSTWPTIRSTIKDYIFGRRKE